MYSAAQVGLTRNNGSYPHEDNLTVTGRRGNGSGALQMRIGRDAELTWETGGEQAKRDENTRVPDFWRAAQHPSGAARCTPAWNIFYTFILGTISCYSGVRSD